MKNSGFVRKPGKVYATLARTSTLKRTGPIKARRKRPTVAEGSRFIDACRGEECYLRVPGICCSIGWAHPSVVDCHSNQSIHGKGAALKAKHEFTVPGCANCHYWLDFGPAPRETKVQAFDAALERWTITRAAKRGIAA
ncbi:hypothetical protein P3T24_004368 [Paraburkholderia sp. GAS33]|uniref:hypothetical protein n=1 Tax=Paraburkholderia sp. GAS33 TaxID=3035130 RepID=UPI003D239ABC